MRQENFRNKTKVNRLTTALLGVFFYIILILILKTIQNWLTIDSTGMKVFSIIEFVTVSVYLVLFTWGNFKNATHETGKTFGKYLLITMLPLAVMTLSTIIISFTGAGSNFGGKWNAVTFIVGPTVFCYIPFGIILRFVSNMPMIALYLIGFVLIILFMYLGYALGNGSRKFSRERELVRAEQDRRMLQRQDEMARQASQERRNMTSRTTTARRRTFVDENDPFKDMESPPIVETEAFTKITDEMIEEAIRLKKINTARPQQISRRTAVNQNNAVKEVKRPQSADATKSAAGTRSTSHLGTQQPSQRKTNVNRSNEAVKQATQNLQRELEFLRKRLEKEDLNKK